MQVAHDAATVLAKVQAEIPDAIILESNLPDGDAFGLCKKIKKKLGHANLPVIIVTEERITRSMMSLITDSGCEEVLSSPLSRGQLYKVLADYLQLPQRSHPRIIVRSAVTARGTTMELKGEVYDLTVSGARLRLPQSFESDSDLDLRIERSVGEPLNLKASVVWQKQQKAWSEVAVQFKDVSEHVTKQLEMLANWQIEDLGSYQLVTVHRGLTERSNFSGLASKLKERVIFDLRHLMTINSVGLSYWVRFLREVPPVVDYSFAHCSVAFCAHAGYIPDVLGRGQLVSCFAPYYCTSCDYEEERELETSQIAATLEPPTFPCPSCGGELVFEDLPDRYFSFLQS
jgi:CheY-like chemotaxis protein